MLDFIGVFKEKKSTLGGGSKSHLIIGKKLEKGGGVVKMRAPFWIKITLDYWQNSRKHLRQF